MVRTRRKGFTLIELIIAITILALLAVGLLAALDPAEQFNKARDTSTRQIAQEISQAVERFSAAQEKYPAEAVAGATTGFPATGGVTTASTLLSSTDGGLILTALKNTGELKANFSTAAGTALGKILLYNDVTNKSVYVCYKPSSKQFKTQLGLYYVWNAASTPAQTTSFTTGYTVSSTGATGNCPVASPGNVTNRDYCAFCFQQ